MTTYRGPNVSITQKFDLTPADISIEDLPSVNVGTAYDVYKKQVVGSSYGVVPSTKSWGAEKVIYDESVIGKRLYDFYPIKVYSESQYGDIELDESQLTIDSNGVLIPTDKSYDVQDTEKIEGV